MASTEPREQRSNEETTRRVREPYARRDIEFVEPTPEQEAEVDRRLAEADQARHGLTCDGNTTRPDQNEAIATMAEHGITVTEEGIARARAMLNEADAKWTPGRRNALREQIGQRPTPRGNGHP